MKLIKSIRSLTRNDRTDPVLIPVYGRKDGKYKQVIARTVIEIRDLPKALEYNWNLSHGYVSRNDHRMILHRYLLNTPDGFETDHKNGITFDNRRSNLRVATTSQNQMNQRLRKDNTSGYKGVSWCKRRQKWEVQIQLKKQKIKLGYFTNVHDAAKAYNKASRKYHDEFGYRNIISEVVRAEETR